MARVFDIAPIVAKALQEISDSGIIVQTGWYDESIKDTHITYLELTDNTEDSSDDEEESVNHLVQIDVWSFDDIKSNNLKELAKALLISNGFFYETGENLPEKKEGKEFYHRAIRVTYCEDKEGDE